MIHPSDIQYDNSNGNAHLGHGASGSVMKAIHGPTKTPVAVKIINAMDHSSQQQLVNDLNLHLHMSDAHSPFLVQLLAAYLVDETKNISNAKVSGSGRIRTCDAAFGFQKNLYCMTSKGNAILATRRGHLSCGIGIAKPSKSL